MIEKRPKLTKENAKTITNFTAKDLQIDVIMNLCVTLTINN